MPEPADPGGAARWFALGLWLLSAGPAAALVGDSDGAFGADASLRTVTGVSYNYDYPLFTQRSDGFSQTLLRLTVSGAPVAWFGYELHAVQELNLTTSGELLGGGLFAGGGSGSQYRVTDAAWEWGQEAHVQARLWLDRLALKFQLPWFDLTVGRQAMTFGKAYFWNPLDVFLAFDPRSFDRDYKAGVDALRIDIPLGAFAGLTLVAVAGRSDAGVDFGADWRGSALLARAYANFWDWDFAVQGGKIFGGFQLGAATAGELGPLELRAEGAYFFALDADPLPDHFTGVIGLGHRFDFELLIEAEYLYNGAGDPDNWLVALTRVASGRSLHMGRHLVGVLASYPILPILQGSLAWIFSASDASSLIQPGLALSVSDEADFLFGAMIALGPRPKGWNFDADDPLSQNLGLQSEFGTYPNFYYMEFKFYF
jgi:hypothetical protein